MPNPTVFPSNLSWLGIAKEGASTYGTPVATPTFWVPLLDPSWKPDQIQLDNEALYGDMAKVHGVVQGPRVDKMSYKSYLLLDNVFQHMMGILGGSDTMTGASDPYTHKTSLGNVAPAQPPSFTLSLFNGAETWQMPGAILDKVEVDIKAETLPQLSAEWTGLPAVKVSNPSNTPSTAKPWPGWNSTIVVNSITATSYSDIKLSYTREVKAIHTADGTISPYIIFGGPVAAEIDLTGVYQGYTGNPTDLSNLLTNTQVPITVQVNPAGDAVHLGKWTHTLCAAKDSEVKDSAGSYVEIQSKYTAIANSTDALNSGTSPAQFQLLSAASTAF